MPKSLTDKEMKALIEWLKRLAWEDAATLLKESWETLNEEKPKASQALTVFHLLRELERMLRDYVKDLGEVHIQETRLSEIKKSSKDANGQLQRVVYARSVAKEAFDIDWKKLEEVLGGKEITLSRFAHSKGMKISDLSNEDIWRHYEAWITSFLKEFLEKFESKIDSANFARLKAIASDSPSESKNLTQLQYALDNPVLRKFFFDNLNNPDWIPTLLGLGVFSIIPQKIWRDETTYSYDYSPAFDYLKRMAKENKLSPAQQQLVADIIKGLPSDIDNPWMSRDCLEIAASLPLSLSLEILPLAKNWLRPLLSFHMIGDYTRWIASLNEKGATKEAVELFELVIEFGFLSEFSEKDSFDFSNNDAWYLRDFASRVLPDLSKSSTQTFEFLVSLTDRVIKEALSKNDNPQESEKWRSYSWKDAGTWGSAEHSWGLIGNLLEVLAESAEAYALNNSDISPLIERLLDTGWLSFRRIAWWLLQRFSSSNLVEVQSQLEGEIGEEERTGPKVKSGWVSHISPVNGDFLKGMTWPQIIEYLTLGEGSKLPEDNWFNEGPDRKGLIEALEAHVALHPRQFLDNWKVVKSLKVNDITDIVSGLAFHDRGEPYPSDNLIDLIDWLVREVLPNASENEQGRIRYTVLRIIRKNYSPQLKLPFIGLNDKLGLILQLLIVPNSLQIEEEKSKISNNVGEVAQIAINTTYSEVVDFILDDIFRVGSEKKSILERPDWAEIKTLLIQLAERDYPSSSYVLGHNLANFFWAEPEWAKTLADLLFKAGSQEKRDSAKLGFLTRQYVVDELAPYYEEWVNALKDLPTDFEVKDWAPERFLMGAVLYYALNNDSFDLNDSNNILVKLFNTAPVALRRKALNRLTQYLEKDSPKVQERAKALWKWRVENGEYEELISIVRWLKPALALDETWALQQLEIVLKKSNEAEENRNSASFRREGILLALREAEITDLEALCAVMEAWSGKVNVGWIVEDWAIPTLAKLWAVKELRPRVTIIVNRLASAGHTAFLKILEID